jgi:phage gp45-like
MSAQLFRELSAKVRNLFSLGVFQKRYAGGAIQIKTFSGRVLEKKESFPYGFYAKAKTGKVLVFCQGGNFDGYEILPLVADEKLTPPELEEGDAAIYTASGVCVICRETGDIEITGNKNIKINGTTVSLLDGGLPAARMTDPAISTADDDQEFWEWVTTISAIVASLSGGSLTPPVMIKGKITKGSEKVTIA